MIKSRVSKKLNNTYLRRRLDINKGNSYFNYGGRVVERLITENYYFLNRLNLLYGVGLIKVKNWFLLFGYMGKFMSNSIRLNRRHLETLKQYLCKECLDVELVRYRKRRYESLRPTYKGKRRYNGYPSRGQRRKTNGITARKLKGFPNVELWNSVRESNLKFVYNEGEL